MVARIMVTLLLAGPALSGCYSPGGNIFHVAGSAMTYYSTQLMPATVTLVDTRTEEAFFSVEIPPGKQLTLDFVRDDGDDPVKTPDLMRYEIFKLGTSTGSLKNSLTVPNAACRRLDVDYRAAPEAVPVPHEQALRLDTEANRPSWWTPLGGERPEADRTKSAYDD